LGDLVEKVENLRGLVHRNKISPNLSERIPMPYKVIVLDDMSAIDNISVKANASNSTVVINTACSFTILESEDLITKLNLKKVRLQTFPKNLRKLIN
jgi:hypothetical protein